MTTLPDLNAFLAAENADPRVIETIQVIAKACVDIARVVQAGSLGGDLASVTDQNVQGEDQKALDVISNDLLSDALMACQPVAGLASEELEYIQPTGRSGGVLVAFDPLDGSSNIDVNVSVGTIFSLLPAPDGRAAVEADFLQPGRKQLAAGYALYGPQNMLVLTVSGKVSGFTLDAAGVWRLTHDGLTVPPETAEFAINMSNQRHWAEPVRAYINDCVAGKDGPRGKNFNMRWVASMVADVHRIMMRGGIFMYPWDAREPDRPGKLRLLYEGAPMSLLIERAGGASRTENGPILDVVPTTLHQRVPVILGAANEVARVHP